MILKQTRYEELQLMWWAFIYVVVLNYDSTVRALDKHYSMKASGIK